MEERWTAQQARLLADIGALFTSLDQIEVLPRIAQRLVPDLADWCAIITRDEHQQMRRIAIACADPDWQPLAEQLTREALLIDPASAPARALELEDDLLLTDLPPDYSDDPAFSPAYQAVLRQIRPRHILCVPMRIQDRACGVLALTLSARSGRRFLPDDIALAHEVAQRLALVVDHVLLYRAMQRRLDQLLLVQRVAALVNSTLQTEMLCRLVVEQLHSVFGYQLISIYLLKDQALHLQVALGYDRVLPIIGLHEGVAGRVMRTGKAAFARDVRRDPDFIEVLPGTTQCIAVPLRYDDSMPMGVIIVEAQGNPPLDDEDFFLLSLLADQISVALVNTMLFARMTDSFERFRSLIELAGNVIICLDPELRITEFNRMAEQIFGRTRSEVIGSDYPATLLNEAERPLFTALAREVIATDRAQSFETSFVRQQRKHYLFWTMSCRRNAQGEPAELLLFCQDLTEQREKTEELLQYERRLQTIERLESLAVMAGSVAHDFNNLLNIIAGHAYIMEKVAPLSPTAQYHFSNLLHAIHQAADLAHRLLGFAGKQQIERQPLDLNQLIAETLPVIRGMISEQAVVHLELDPDLPMVMVDPIEMRQVLMNLVVNAVEALPDGRGNIWIQTASGAVPPADSDRFVLQQSLKPGRYTLMAVRDDGSGIDPAVYQRIFEPFFTTKEHGTGLGLAGVLKIVQRYGGALEVESQPGKGSAFTVWLPPLSLTEMGSNSLNAEHASFQILVVDDNSGVRALIERMLSQAGYRSQMAVSGSEAIQLVDRETGIACALIDISLPDMSGYEVCRQLASRHPDLPLALMSGYPLDAADLGEAPVAAMLQKPFRVSELLSIVKYLLQVRSAAASTSVNSRKAGGVAPEPEGSTPDAN